MSSEIHHSVQKNILDVLVSTNVARFRDLRPPNVDTNLCTYHLQLLIKAAYVQKVEQGYILARKGLLYAHYLTTSVSSLERPNSMTMLLIQNADGDVLLQKQLMQPYIHTWRLPSGDIYNVDATIKIAAQRLASEIFSGMENVGLRHVGDCYVRVYMDETILATTYAHIFRTTCDFHDVSETYVWVNPYKLHSYTLAPGVAAIIARCFFGDDYFFEEYVEEWEFEKINALKEISQ